MRIILWHLAFVPVVWPGLFVNGAAVLTRPLVPASIIQPQHPTNASLTNGVPPGFKVVIQSPRGPEISKYRLLEAAVLLIGNHLALEDFTGKIPSHGWTLSDLMITVWARGTSGDTIERRYFIWGMFLAFRQMAEENDFRSAVFELEWRGNLVGSVVFCPKNYPGLDTQIDSENMTTQLTSSLSTFGSGTNESVLLSPSTVGAPALELVFTKQWPPQRLSRFGMLINLIGVLMEAAEHSADAVVEGRYLTSVRASGVRVFISGKDGAETPTRPPFLRYRWIVKALTTVPKKLADLKSYDAFLIELLLDHISVGEILVLPTESGLAQAASNPYSEASVNVSIG